MSDQKNLLFFIETLSFDLNSLQATKLVDVILRDFIGLSVMSFHKAIQSSFFHKSKSCLSILTERLLKPEFFQPARRCVRVRLR